MDDTTKTRRKGAPGFLRFCVIGVLGTVVVGLLEASDPLRAAPLDERLEALYRLAATYGGYGLVAAILVSPSRLLGRFPAWLALGALWVAETGLVFGTHFREGSLGAGLAREPLPGRITVFMVVAAFISAFVWIQLVSRKRIGLLIAGGICAAVTGVIVLEPEPGLTSPPPEALPTNAPNVVLILADTLRQDHLGHAGDPRGLSPHLDRFARGAVQLSDARSTSSWTLPAVASLMVSAEPRYHGANGHRSKLSGAYRTLAEWLSAIGYRTGCFTGSPLISSLTGLHRGFQRMWNPNGMSAFDVTALGRLARRWPWLPMVRRREQLQLGLGRETVRKALAWLDASSSAPFFLYAHFLETHSPYAPPREITGPTASGATTLEAPESDGPFPFVAGARFSPAIESDYKLLYAGAVRDWDERLGDLLSGLAERGLLDRSIVIVASDHGEELLDHGSWGHGTTLFDEVNRVELLWSGPGTGRSRLVGGPSSLLDVFPTLQDLIRVPERPTGGAPERPALAGISLLPVFRGEKLPARDLLLEVAWPFRSDALVRGHFKAISVRYHDATKQMAFDLASDPAEQNSLPVPDANGAAVVNALQRRLDSSDQPSSTQPAEELEPALRALGYVQ